MYQFDPRDLQLIEALFDQWGVLSIELKENSDARSAEVIKKMEKLKSALGLDEIMY